MLAYGINSQQTANLFDFVKVRCLLTKENTSAPKMGVVIKTVKGYKKTASREKKNKSL